jgi:hypothetical protein
MVASSATIEAIKISFAGDLNLAVSLESTYLCIIVHFKGETNCCGFRNTVDHTI